MNLRTLWKVAFALIVVSSSSNTGIASALHFAAPLIIPNLGYMQSLIVTNLDNDQNNDVVALSDRSVSVLTGNGHGGFTSTNTFGSGYIFSSVAAGDVNNDGLVDLVLLDLKQVHWA